MSLTDLEQFNKKQMIPVDGCYHYTNKFPFGEQAQPKIDKVYVQFLTNEIVQTFELPVSTAYSMFHRVNNIGSQLWNATIKFSFVLFPGAKDVYGRYIQLIPDTFINEGICVNVFMEVDINYDERTITTGRSQIGIYPVHSEGGGLFSDVIFPEVREAFNKINSCRIIGYSVSYINAWNATEDHIIPWKKVHGDNENQPADEPRKEKPHHKIKAINDFIIQMQDRGIAFENYPAHKGSPYVWMVCIPIHDDIKLSRVYEALEKSSKKLFIRTALNSNGGINIRFYKTKKAMVSDFASRYSWRK